jgi:hypothetical protein
VGHNGKLVLFDSDRSNCFLKVQQIHQLTNVEFVRRTPGLYQRYSNIISKNNQFLKSEIDNGLLKKMPQQMLVDLKEESVLQRLRNEQSVTVKRVTLNNSDCKSSIKAAETDSNELGFYQIIRNDFKPK